MTALAQKTVERLVRRNLRFVKLSQLLFDAASERLLVARSSPATGDRPG